MDKLCMIFIINSWHAKFVMSFQKELYQMQHNVLTPTIQHNSQVPTIYK